MSRQATAAADQVLFIFGHLGGNSKKSLLQAAVKTAADFDLDKQQLRQTSRTTLHCWIHQIDLELEINRNEQTGGIERSVF